jgi:hypothetical protein
LELYEEIPLSKDPPEATIARRAKSYNNFYEIASGYLQQQIKDDIVPDVLDSQQYQSINYQFENWYENCEDDLLDASHEEYRYVSMN